MPLPESILCAFESRIMLYILESFATLTPQDMERLCYDPQEWINITSQHSPELSSHPDLQLWSFPTPIFNYQTSTCERQPEFEKTILYDLIIVYHSHSSTTLPLPILYLCNDIIDRSGVQDLKLWVLLAPPRITPGMEIDIYYQTKYRDIIGYSRLHQNKLLLC